MGEEGGVVMGGEWWGVRVRTDDEDHYNGKLDSTGARLGRGCNDIFESQMISYHSISFS